MVDPISRDRALTLGSRAAGLALDMLALVADLIVQFTEDFSVRIGINTGPVVGRGIGKKKSRWRVGRKRPNRSHKVGL